MNCEKYAIENPQLQVKRIWSAVLTQIREYIHYPIFRSIFLSHVKAVSKFPGNFQENTRGGVHVHEIWQQLFLKTSH